MPDLVLQRVLAPFSSKPETLYLHRTGSVDIPPDQRTVFRLGAGAGIDFDSYFGALFESHWRANATLRGLRLRAWATAGLRLRLWRLSPAGRAMLHESRAPHDGIIEIEIPTAGDHDNSARLALTVLADPTGGELRDIAWVCDRPAHASRLAAGFCAFGDRARALLSAAALAADRPPNDSLVRIVVVDQSGQDSADTVVAGIDILRQANLGGTGGFTRIMLEALATHGATHVLLLDDDIDIDPEVVHRICALNRVLRHPRVVAGQMLDMLAPTTLQETGAILDPVRLRIVPNGRGIDAATGLDRLHAMPKIDYAAWFCCALPLDAIRRCGLPLPLFINFDDVEYGLRLTAGEVPPVGLPGIGVWHMPGYAKDDDWRIYFYHRNIAVIAAIHGVADRRRLAVNFARRAIKALWQGDLFRLAVACDGIADFLAGPDSLRQPAAHILQRITMQRRRLASHWRIGAIGQGLHLIPRVVACLAGLARRGPRAMSQWRAQSADLASPEWWRRYLDKAGPPPV